MPGLGFHVSNQCTLEMILTVAIGRGRQLVQLLSQKLFDAKR